MRKYGTFFALLCGLILLGVGTTMAHLTKNSAALKKQTKSAAPAISIGGEPVVTLTRPRQADKSKPQFLQATVLPGNGMNLVQLKAYLPGKGEINVLYTKTLPEVKQFLEKDNDAYGNNSFKLGGAILLPYPNRIRGKLSADKKTLETTIAGKQVTLPANWADKGDRTKGEIHAMHGLIMSSKFQDVQHANRAKESTVSALLHAGNFGGHWLSKTDVKVRMALQDDQLDIFVTTTNVGKETLPMAIGFHPYFAFPSGERQQVRLHVPAKERLLVNNYSDVFPTGKTVPVKGTEYDFSAADGAPLKQLYMDDCFTDLERNKDGNVEVRIVDPAAKYGVRILGMSPHIKAVQVYAPPDQSYTAVEPQFNLADPYNKKIWDGRDTGMVNLAPGQSVTWHVRLELFIPKM